MSRREPLPSQAAIIPINKMQAATIPMSFFMQFSYTHKTSDIEGPTDHAGGSHVMLG